MISQLKQLLIERKSAWEQLSKLKSLSSAGEINEDQFRRLGAEYQKRLEEADQRVTSFKKNIQAKVSIVRTTLQAYEGQLRRFAQEHSEGKYEQRQYEAQVQKIVEQRASYVQEQRLHLLEAMLKAELPEHLNGLELVTARDSEAASERGSLVASVWDTVLRTAGIILAAAIVVSVFVPFFAGPLEGFAEEGSSLARAALASSSRSRFGLLFAVVPVGVAIGVALICLARGRGLRGTLLLILGIFTCLIAAIGLAFVFSYPNPVLQQAKNILTGQSFEVGLPLLFGLLGGVQVLSLLHLLPSRKALILWFLGLFLVLMTAVGTTLFLHHWVRVGFSISLEKMPGDSKDPSLRAEVKNVGNVPSVIQKVLGNATSLNQFGLQVQQRLDAGWENATANLATDMGDLSDAENISPAQTFNIIVDPEVPKDAESVTFRVGLARPGAQSWYSNEVTIELPAPPPPPPIPSTIPPEEDARNRVTEICNRLKNAKVGSLITEIQETRVLVNQLLLASEKKELNDAMDKGIVGAKDREARDLSNRASEAYQREAYEQAVQVAQQILKLYTNDPKPLAEELTAEEQILLEQTQELLRMAQLAADPTQRYTLTGTFNTGNQLAAFLQDNIKGERLQVVSGNRLGDWSVQSVTMKSVMLQKNGLLKELHK